MSDRRRKDGLSFYCRHCSRLRLRASQDKRRGGPPTHRYPRNVVVPGGFKWCPDCQQVRTVEDFSRTRANKSGINAYCKPCHSARGKASKDKVGGSRTYHLLQRRYGITAEDADRMFAAQDGLCAICCERPAEHVDHDHATGLVRGLLCFNCNGGLGQLRDDVVLLDSAGSYLDSHLPARTDVAVLARLARALNDCPGTTLRRRPPAPCCCPLPRRTDGYPRRGITAAAARSRIGPRTGPLNQPDGAVRLGDATDDGQTEPGAVVSAVWPPRPKGLKMRSASWGGTPWPLSSTHSRTIPLSTRAPSSMRSPSEVCFAASSASCRRAWGSRCRPRRTPSAGASPPASPARRWPWPFGEPR